MNTEATGNTVQVKTICPYSSSLCPCRDGVIITVENGRVVGLEADKEHPLSKGHICAKGLHSWELMYHSDRFKQPMLKTASGWKEISWEDALDTAAERFGEVKQKWGPLSFCAANVFSVLSPGLLVQHGVMVSMDGKGSYNDNLLIERLWQTVK